MADAVVQTASHFKYWLLVSMWEVKLPLGNWDCRSDLYLVLEMHLKAADIVASLEQTAANSIYLWIAVCIAVSHLSFYYYKQKQTNIDYTLTQCVNIYLHCNFLLSTQYYIYA